MGKDFNPTEKLKNYHVSVARGGVGMTTLAYASINRSGISFNSQLWLRDEILPALKDITDAIHAEGAATSIQIGHCGNMTHWSTAGSFPVSASNGFNLYSPTFHRRMKKSEIIETAKDFGKAVYTAHEAGFDCVEAHAGHGYLISQFLSPWTNRRRDEFGGSLENRMRFMKMCLEEIMEAAAKTGTSVLVKHNMEDGFKSGIQIPESIEIAKEIEKYNVNGIVLSSGFVSRAPMAVMRGRIPTKTMSYYMGWNEWLQKIVVDLFGQWMIKQYDFEECFFLENALKFREALKGPLVYVGGIVSREGIEKVLNSGFEMVQIARALVNDPNFVNNLKAGDITTRSGCDHKDYCIARMYSVDMQCCHNCNLEKLPKRVRKELGL
jgi:2,4-dienoyl-CoA reductase-like NADH-dependent reductase (Old Yellow Enzyme family)